MNGLIAFFDILGYKSFLENTSAEESARKVLKLITQTTPRVKDTIGNIMLNSFVTKDKQEVANAVKHLIFSDTVVVFIAYPLDASTAWRDAAFGHLSMVSGCLFAEMFVYGLPMRGAIVEGEFYVEEMCFAGRGILDAHSLCDSLNFSGLVCSPSLGSRAANAFVPDRLNHCIVVYLSPLNESKEAMLTHVNWIDLLPATDAITFHSDIATFVHKAFWAHGKDCPVSLDVKIQNTIKLCRRLAIALEPPQQSYEQTI